MPESIDFLNVENENLSKPYNYWCFGTGCCPGMRFPFVFLVFLQRQNLQKPLRFMCFHVTYSKPLLGGGGTYAPGCAPARPGVLRDAPGAPGRSGVLRVRSGCALLTLGCALGDPRYSRNSGLLRVDP